MENPAIKAGLKGGTGAGLANRVSPAAEIVTMPPWQPRADGKQAILVNERATVFDHKLPPPPPVDRLVDISDPLWNSHKSVWTPDLVHCRLLNVGDTVARLPSPIRRGYVSLLRDAALAEVDRKRPPTAAEVSIADWTWAQLLKRPATQRALLQAMAFGASGDSVAKMLNRSSSLAVHRTTVNRWYLSERRHLTSVWALDKHPVDRPSFEC